MTYTHLYIRHDVTDTLNLQKHPPTMQRWELKASIVRVVHVYNKITFYLAEGDGAN